MLRRPSAIELLVMLALPALIVCLMLAAHHTSPWR